MRRNDIFVLEIYPCNTNRNTLNKLYFPDHHRFWNTTVFFLGLFKCKIIQRIVQKTVTYSQVVSLV